MKLKTLAVIVFLAILGITFAADMYPPSNYQPIAVTSGTRIRPYDIVIFTTEEANDSNDTALTATTKYWDAIKPENGVFKVVPNWSNVLEIAFIVQGDAADANYVSDPCSISFNFNIYAARWFSSAVKVYSGAAACGELTSSRNPGSEWSELDSSGNDDPNYKYVSGITSTVDNWVTTCTLIDATESNNGLARIKLDFNGYGIVWSEITGITGGRVKKIYTIISGY